MPDTTWSMQLAACVCALAHWHVRRHAKRSNSGLSMFSQLHVFVLQAEREMLQRSSFEAARRNSMSSDVGMGGGSELGRQDSYLGAPCGLGGGLGFNWCLKTATNLSDACVALLYACMPMHAGRLNITEVGSVC